MPIPQITACVITYNEERNIGRCLDSIRWVDEIVVVDSYSTDGTLNICREYTNKIFLHHFNGYIEQKNFALQCAANEWVLCIDADEELSPSLIDEIHTELEENQQRCDGFLFPRHAFYLGRWINHCGWYPDYKLRLFKKSLGRWGGTDPHDKVELSGQVKRLRNDLLHYTYRNLSHHLKTIDNYSDIYSRNALKCGGKYSIAKILLRPAVKFLEVYIYKKGVMDGLPGFIIALTSSYCTFLRYAKMWEAEKTKALIT